MTSLNLSQTEKYRAFVHQESPGRWPRNYLWFLQGSPICMFMYNTKELSQKEFHKKSLDLMALVSPQARPPWFCGKSLFSKVVHVGSQARREPRPGDSLGKMYCGSPSKPSAVRFWENQENDKNPSSWQNAKEKKYDSYPGCSALCCISGTTGD